MGLVVTVLTLFLPTSQMFLVDNNRSKRHQDKSQYMIREGFLRKRCHFHGIWKYESWPEEMGWGQGRTEVSQEEGSRRSLGCSWIWGGEKWESGRAPPEEGT